MNSLVVLWEAIIVIYYLSLSEGRTPSRDVITQFFDEISDVFVGDLCELELLVSGFALQVHKQCRTFIDKIVLQSEDRQNLKL